MKISGFTIEAWSILRRVKVLSDAPLGQSGPTSWLDSGQPGRAHITCHPLRANHHSRESASLLQRSRAHVSSQPRPRAGAFFLRSARHRAAPCPAHAGRASPRQLRDGHHKKALFIAEPRKKNRAFLTAPALAGISSDLMQSQEATDDCRQRPIGLRAQAQIRDDGPNMETYHEGTYRRSRVGHADCSPDIRSARRAGCPASRVRFPD
jgi:hypothetical protein